MLETKNLEIAAKHLELIERRGKRLGFRGADLDDAVQEAAIAVMTFEFDEQRANGATLETALTAVIDRCLRALRRKQSRYARHLQRFLDAAHAEWTNVDAEPVEPHHQVPTDLQLDVRRVLEGLSAGDRQLCEHLATGRSVHQIAELLGCDWHTARRQIDRLRETFVARGLDHWLSDEEVA